MPRWPANLLIFALCLSSWVLTIGTSAKADDAEGNPFVLRVFNNFAHEHAACAAYYIVGSMCLNSEDDRDLRDQLRQAGGTLIARGKDWTKKARLKPETLVARIEMSRDEMIQKIGNCENISLILKEHGKSCKSLVEEPLKRLESLTNELAAKSAVDSLNR